MTSTPRPAISLVTPNYNGAAFLESTIQSVLSQNCAELEYVLVDGASTDTSPRIIERYRDCVAAVIAEPDEGHADALNKGFARTRGEIMGWINSDDILLPGCLSVVSRIFATYPQVSWITGLPSTCDEAGRLTYVGPLKPWSRLRFLAGDHLWIQQESTFWRRSLWDAAGGGLDTQLKVANDFDLWARFFRHADLYSVDSMLGCFRVREGQRSVAGHALYMREVDAVLKRELEALEPDVRDRAGPLIPAAPRHLGPAERAAFEPALGQDDPPVITRHGLRARLPLDAPSAIDARDRPRAPAIKASSAGWADVARRNWRFLAAGLVVLTAGIAAALLLPQLAVWIALAIGLGGAFGLSAAVAIKTRRIVRTLIAAIENTQISTAQTAYSRHLVEQELDELGERRQG